MDDRTIPPSTDGSGELTWFRMQDTPFGAVAILWSRHEGVPSVVRIFLSRPGRELDSYTISHSGNIGERSCQEIESIADGILSILSGRPVELSLTFMRLDLCTEFQRKVLMLERRVPRGRVVSYGRLALLLGVPGGARAVGRALSTNPFPIAIPCHRAVRADGSTGGYQGGKHMKHRLLRMEGVEFHSTGKILKGFFTSV